MSRIRKKTGRTKGSEADRHAVRNGYKNAEDIIDTLEGISEGGDPAFEGNPDREYAEGVRALYNTFKVFAEVDYNKPSDRRHESEKEAQEAVSKAQEGNYQELRETADEVLM